MHIEELRNAYEYIPDGLAIIDNKDSFIYINSNCAKLFGYDVQEMKEKIVFSSLFAPIYIDNPAKNNYIPYTEYDMLHKSGEIFQVALTLTPIGNSHMKLVIFRSMKDIKNAKKQGLQQILSFAQKNTALIKYGFDKLGPVPEVFHETDFIEEVENLAPRLGVFYLTSIQDSPGLYGPLPVLDYPDLLALVYYYKIDEEKAREMYDYIDDRFYGKVPAFILIIFHKSIESLIVDRKRLLRTLERAIDKKEFSKCCEENYSKMLKAIKQELLSTNVYISSDNSLEKKLHTINQIAREHHQFVSIRDIFEKIGEVAESVLGFDRFTAWYIDRSQMALRLLVQKGYDTNLSSLTININERSIVAKVARTGNIINLDNVKEAPEYLEVNSKIKSELAVPIRSPINSSIVGVLNVESINENHFTVEDEIILEALANKTANYVHFEETNTRFLAMHNLLYELNKGDTADLDAVFKRVGDFVDATFNYKLFSILIYNKERQELEMRENREYENESIQSFRISINSQDSFVAKCARENRTINVGDISTIDYYYEANGEVKSELAVPINIDNEIYGVINVESKAFNAFSKTDERLLEMLSKITAMIIKTKCA